MAHITADECRNDPPTLWVACQGKRQMARTRDNGGKAEVIITDNATLARLKGDGTFLVEWSKVADTINANEPLLLEESEPPKTEAQEGGQ